MKNLTTDSTLFYNLFISLVLVLALVTGAIPTQVEATTVQRISVSNNGEEANRSSEQPFISEDGRFVAFVSKASNLVEGDTNKRDDVFVYDLLEHKIERVSVDSNGNEAFVDNDASCLKVASAFCNRYPSISADGRYVVFQSQANNLVVNDTNKKADVFVHDRKENTTRRISFAKKIEPGGVASPMISANGEYVVFYNNSYKDQKGFFYMI